VGRCTASHCSKQFARESVANLPLMLCQSPGMLCVLWSLPQHDALAGGQAVVVLAVRLPEVGLLLGDSTNRRLMYTIRLCKHFRVSALLSASRKSVSCEMRIARCRVDSK